MPASSSQRNEVSLCLSSSSTDSSPAMNAWEGMPHNGSLCMGMPTDLGQRPGRTLPKLPPDHSPPFTSEGLRRIENDAGRSPHMVQSAMGISWPEEENGQLPGVPHCGLSLRSEYRRVPADDAESNQDEGCKTLVHESQNGALTEGLEVRYTTACHVGLPIALLRSRRSSAGRADDS
jgi:hypothetical protein